MTSSLCTPGWPITWEAPPLVPMLGLSWQATKKGEAEDACPWEVPDIEGVWEALQAKRDEWARADHSTGDDFLTQVRGGAWTAAVKGSAADCIVGQAKKGLPTTWCGQYKLNKMASFSFAKYGERTAWILATEWTRRMQYFYDVWSSSGNSEYVYSATDKEGVSSAERETPEWKVFVDSVPLAGPLKERVDAILALRPS
jgi:hypothetical protein